MTSFLALFAALNREKVQYLVAGGWAVNLYGIERATGDIDLVVWLEPHNVEQFVKVMKEMGLKPKVPVSIDEFRREDRRNEWIRDKGMRAFSFFDPKTPYFLLDVLIEIPFDFQSTYAQRSEMSAGDTIIPVVPLRTLIEMKEKAGRPQDLADVFYLKQVEGEEHNG